MRTRLNITMILILSLLWLAQGVCLGAEYYVRADATGNNDGTDWDNAFVSLSAAEDAGGYLERGATYYVAAGSYGDHTFDTPVDGEKYIYIKKATMAEHGTEIGWQDSYAQPAIWPNLSRSEGLVFKTGYWVFDGVTGGGLYNWTSGHGFVVHGGEASITRGYDGMIVLGNRNQILPSPSHIQIKHCELTRPGRVNTPASSDSETYRENQDRDVALYSTLRYYEDGEEIPMADRKGLGVSDVTISHCYFHHMNMFIKSSATTNWTLEYNYFERTYPDDYASPSPSQTTALYDGSSDDMTIKYNIFENIQGKVIDIKENFIGQTNYRWHIYGNVFYQSPETLEWERIDDLWAGLSEGAILYASSHPDDPGAICSDMHVYNNIFVNLNTPTSLYNKTGVYIPGAGSSGNKVYNNIWYASESIKFDPATTQWDYNIYSETGFVTGIGANTNDIETTGNPFIDWQNGDFRLNPATPAGQLAIDSGMDLGIPYNVDMFGNIRGAGGNWDRGAVEYIEPAATYYVDAVNGNDANPGTSDEPWASLDRAYTWYSGQEEPKVEEGDTVLFRDGNYGSFVESTNVDPGKNYLFYRNDWITYKADAGHTPELSSITIQNLDKWGGAGNGDSYLVFDGFQIADQLLIFYTSHVKVLNCDITQTPEPYAGTYAPYYAPNRAAIRGRDSNYITIENNHIHNVYRGVCPSGEYWTVKDNTIHYLAEDGINGPVSNSTIEGNLISDSNPYRTCRNIYGTLTGTFAEGDTVTQAGIGAVGIALSWAGSYLNVYQTTPVEFKKQGDGGGTVTGPEGTVSNITLIDGSHIDAIHIEKYTRLHDVIITGNAVYDMSPTQGISLYGHEVFDHFTIENNLVSVPYVSGNKTLVISGVSNVKINNNTFVGSYVRFENTAAHPYTSIIDELYNNIIEVTSFEIDHEDSYIQVVSHGNNIFGNNPDGSCGPSYPFIVNSTETVNYDVNSLFVDPANYDFHLTEDSLARDFGDPLYAPLTDIEGNLRDAYPDAGCYEYTSSTFIYGDINGNNEVTGLDASLAARHAVGLITLVGDEFEKADVTGADGVTGYDASWIARKAVDPTVVFPIEQ